MIAIVGTTIAPWQLFFQQSCVAEKRLRFADLKWARLDTLIGATFTVCVASAMMLVGNYGFEHKVAFQDPGATRPHVRPHCRRLRSQWRSAIDGQRCRAWNDGHLAHQRMGLWRGEGLGAFAAQEAMGSS